MRGHSPASLDTLEETLYQLFCVSLHENAWIAAELGVWEMETYLERFWSCSIGRCGTHIVVRDAKSLVVTAWFILESICSYPVK